MLHLLYENIMELLHVFTSTWVISLTVIIFSCFLYVNKLFSYWKNHGISSPTNGVWSCFVGMHRLMKVPVHFTQMELYQKYGRIHGIYFGFQPQLFIAEPHILKNILVKDFNMFHNRTKFKSGNPVLDKMLSILIDEDWKRIRCIMSPTFTSSRMRKMAYLIQECAENFSKSMTKIVETEGDQPIDCKKYLYNFSIDVIASTAFGTKLSSLEDPNNEFVSRSREFSNSDVSILRIIAFIFPKIMSLLKTDVFGESFEFFKEFASHVIKQREKENTKRNDFLQLLMEAQKGVLEISSEDAKEKEGIEFNMLPKHKTMSTEEMMAQCVLFLFAGTETTTNTLSILFHYMALNPENQDKLIKEIDEAWSANENMNFDALNSMQYLDAVVCETLRKEPIALQLVRECTEEYEISEIGFKIPKGMNVFVPIYAMHQDKDFYPNPENFDPERFLPENRASIPPYVYLPFGEGPRNCIGMRFAMMILKMCVVYIFRDFRIRATKESTPLDYFTGQGLIQPKKVMVKFERR